MSPMDYELLVVEYIATISDLWGIWLTSTFAFIVAFHAGRASITKLLIWVGCLLYSAIALVTILRYLGSVYTLAGLRLLLENTGSENLSSGFFGNAITLLTLGTMCIGTLAAIYFAICQYRAKNDT